MIEAALPTWQIYRILMEDPVAVESFKAKLINWLRGFEQFSYLDSNGHRLDPYHQYDLLVGIGCQDVLQANAGEDAFGQLKSFQNQYAQAYLFGYLAYDLKNEVEALSSTHPDLLAFPDLLFFVPEHRIVLQHQQLTIASQTLNPRAIYQEIQAVSPSTTLPNTPSLDLQARIQPSQYLNTVERIRQEIAKGNIYELNFCQEFFHTEAQLDPYALFQTLREKTTTPFAAFFRWQDRFALCASPERFLARRGQQLVSQPIKGTIRRGANPEEDQELREALYHSSKNRAENVMIVDLVRNDLARTCETGSVQVEELFGIYSFSTVHQMISTVKGTMKHDLHPVDAIKAAFPMGSMTGAPKVRSMELIEQLESSRRGLYSGAIGYFAPGGDFDFNVVIRSLLYHQAQTYLSLQVGGAIVYDSDPEEEYAECLLKAERLRAILRQE